jgi:DNA invertase Pin-like site-specific DNA recombinase
MICPHCQKEIGPAGVPFGVIEDRGKQQKVGMAKQASQGKHVSRVPFGYKRNSNSELIPSQNYQEVEEIFEKFLQPGMNLRQLSQKHNLSVNGLKKILKNFAYVGKVKFDGQIHQGKHKAIVSSILFNKVQDKLENKK